MLDSDSFYKSFSDHFKKKKITLRPQLTVIAFRSGSEKRLKDISDKELKVLLTNKNLWS